jgi:cytochrome c-type biogenesis protein CcmF
MISHIGNFFLALAVSSSFLQFSIPILKKALKLKNYENISAIMTRFHFLFISISFSILIWAFVVSDFSFLTVWNNSHTAKPLLYKITGTWGNHEGSMLLWCWVMALYGFLITQNYQFLSKELKENTLMFQGLLCFGFGLYLFFASNPLLFNEINTIEGKGLNPLLQDPGLAFHPPFLYLGYVGLSIVWSFALAGILEKKIDKNWGSYVRPWVVISWVFLTIGITLGSWWAYYELGWGGYWFWDPVENASLIPWLIATALLHTTIAVEKKGVLINWCILLAIMAFGLSVIGTFIVRSGLITSVHAFANDPLRGVFILGLLSLYTILSFSMYALRIKKEREEIHLNILSKETFFIFNNLLLSVLALTVFVGTIYPLILEVLSNERISVGPPFFVITVIPIALLIAFLAAIGPLLAWDKNSSKTLLKRIILPSVLTIVLVIIIYKNFLSLTALSVLGILIGIWLLSSSIQNIFQFRLFGFKNWATFLGHSGFALLILGISFSSSLQNEYEGTLKVGSSIQFKDYKVEFLSVKEFNGKNYISSIGKFNISKQDLNYTLEPEKRYYPAENSLTTEASIISKNFSQLYMVIGEKINDETWVVRIWHKPFILLIWIGGIVIASGGFLSLSSVFLKKQIIRSFIILAFTLPFIGLFAKEFNPEIEERIHRINLQIRCMVCQTQTIDDSDAQLAKDLRAIVRQKVIEGETEEEIFTFFRNRYGDYILMKPPLQQNTIILWLTPFLGLLFGFLIIYRFLFYKRIRR